MSLLKPSYRARRRWRSLGMFLGGLTAVVLVVWGCWLLWLGRYVVYSRDAALLDFDWQTPGAFVTAQKPQREPVTIVYDDGKELVQVQSKDLQRLSGVYITTSMLTEDLEAVERLIWEQPKGSAIMLELKSGGGNFYYETAIPDAPISSRVNTDGVAQLIKNLRKSDYYILAAVPAFRDRAYGLENTSQGILHSSGGYLWAGLDKCYWLDPANAAVVSYLTSVCTELRDLGFDEVVLTDFSFPPTEAILYEGDRVQALNAAAARLAQDLITEDFCLSFLCNTEGFVLPQGRTRLYRDQVDAAAVQEVAMNLDIPSMEVNLVFLTEANDTRFNAFGVLRPLAMIGTPQSTTPTETTAPAEPEA